MPSLQTAWALVERCTVPPDAPLAQRLDAQTAFYMGVHAAVSAQLAAATGADPVLVDILAVLEDEVAAYFELLATPITRAN